MATRRQRPAEQRPKAPARFAVTGHQKRLVWALVGGLLLAVAIVYGQTVGFGFQDYDDPDFVRNCPQVAGGLTAANIYWAFTNGPFGEWYPLAMLSHMLDCQLFGIGPPAQGHLGAGGHHLTGVLLHALASVGLLLVLLQMTGEIWPSALATMLFAIHPQHVESVAWIAERRDVLSGLFFVLTLAAYVAYVRRGRTIGRYLLVALMLALGLMAKSMLVTVPPLLLLLDYWPLGRYGQAADLPLQAVDTPRPGFWILAAEKLPLLAIAAADGGITLATHFDHGQPIRLPWSDRIANALISLATYVCQFFDPTGLAPFYPVPAEGYPPWKVAGAAALLVGWTGLAVMLRRRCPYLLVGWLWFLGMMFPVLGLVHISDHAMGDRYTYLPTIGLAIAVSWSIARLAARWPTGRVALGCGAAAVLVILLVLSNRQVRCWHDSVALWRHALAVTGENSKAEGNLAFALSEASQSSDGQVDLAMLDQAIDHYRRALRPPLDPRNLNNYGIALAKRGSLDEALPQFLRAAEMDPKYVEPHINLGTLFALQGHPDEAIEEYLRAIQLNPALVGPHVKVARILVQQGRLDAAIDHLEKALQLGPSDPTLHAELAVALERGGRVDEALAEYRRALEIDPSNTAVRQALDRLIESQRPRATP